MRDLVDISFLFDKRYKEIGIIDVRSENEFLEDHIPNAINIPILNNEERAIVGTIYKQKGHKDARLKGVSIVAPKLEDFIMKVKDVTDRFGDTLIYCWRGGLRSEASVTFSRLAGLTVSRLSGGYKSYRSEVNRFMEEDVGKFNFITVYGPTGSAKTKILSFINSDQYPFLDIEKYACHKGSSFGHIEEAGYPFVTQKNFESNIYYDLI
ncbi:MAG: tRNA 2-selenouridine synthase, partial [Calditerrivibrio sp.]|nr:tRNA 2-selenouridine synthase [Calditerrivibrio sp.]